MEEAFRGASRQLPVVRSQWPLMGQIVLGSRITDNGERITLCMDI
jgi:hypothetical protein